MKKFKFWKILVAVLLVCVLSFSLIACNPEDPDPTTETTKSWVTEKTEALNLILGTAASELSNGFSSIKEEVVSIDLSASWKNTPTDAKAEKQDFTISLRGNIDITGGKDTSLMFEITNNSLTENKLVFGAYFEDGDNPDIYLKLKNDKTLTGDIFGDEPYMEGRIAFTNIANIAGIFTGSSTESTVDMGGISIDTIIAAVAGFCEDPVDADPTSTANPYITTNSDGSKDVKITIDLESVMNMVKTMGGVLVGFISPSSDGKTNDYNTLSAYFEAAGIYTKVGSEWKPLSQSNLPACTGVDIVLSAKISASSELQNLAIEFINGQDFEFPLAVPTGNNTFKELINFKFTAGSAKLSVDTLNVGGKDDSIKTAVASKIEGFGAIEKSNAISFHFDGTVRRYDTDYTSAEEVFNYEFNIDIDVIQAVIMGVNYGIENKVTKTEDMTDEDYNEACYNLTMGIADTVLGYLKISNAAKIEYWMGNGTETDTYLYFDASKINTTPGSEKAPITLYTTTKDDKKVKSTLDLYDIIKYIATAVFTSEEKDTSSITLQSVLFKAIKTLSSVWGNIEIVDTDGDNVADYTEINKNFIEGLYAIFEPTKGTKESIDVVIDTLFGGYAKMAISIDFFKFGNVQLKDPAPSDLGGFTGGVELSTDSFAVSEIQVGKKVEVDGKTFKVLDYLITERDESNNITKAKVIAWTCDDDSVVTLDGGCVVFDITGTDITIKDVNGEPIA